LYRAAFSAAFSRLEQQVEILLGKLCGNATIFADALVEEFSIYTTILENSHDRDRCIDCIFPQLHQLHLQILRASRFFMILFMWEVFFFEKISAALSHAACR